MEFDPQIAALITGLRDDRPGLRQFSLRRLVGMGPQAIPGLIELLADPDEGTQEYAAIALATFGSAAIPPLLDAMKHDNRRIRWGAAWVLASMGPEARNVIPEVPIPGAQPQSKQKPAKIGSGVWSDSWLTKVRQQLNAARAGNGALV
ncbi:MAG TPA: HEAT repeat domain-containing protein [Planctomycetota bacterium]|jgi:hypothetical protein